MSWSGEDCPPSPVAPMADETRRSPKLATVWASGRHELKPAFRYPPHRSARLRIVQRNGTQTIGLGVGYEQLHCAMDSVVRVDGGVYLSDIDQPLDRSGGGADHWGGRVV